MQNEVWRKIPNYEGYQVSNLGNVKSLKLNKEKILSNRLCGIKSNQYLSVVLYLNGKRKDIKIHQLVAMAFLNHTPCGMELVIDHINDNKLDNRVENLQVVTTRYNACKTQGKYSSQYKGVYYDKKRNKWQVKIFINGKNKHLGYFIDEYEAHLEYQKALDEIKKGK